MPPARRQLRALGSLQLVGYANNPTKVITELAFIADERVNDLAEGSQSDFDTPLEVHFNEFMDGVNSRGKGAKTSQRKMTVEQASAVLLVTVQKGHVELIAKKNDPHTIDVIKILPGAKRILASFLPKLRGYGDIPYDQQYRGAIALAKRHFFPKGRAPTKKELMALLLQCYQEKRELSLQYQTQSQATKTLGIQTSFIDGSSYTAIASGESALSVHTTACSNTVEIPNQCNSQSSVEQPNNDVVDVESTAVTSEVDLDFGDDDNHDMFSKPETEPVQLVASTPVAPRSFNPYMTPMSNPRHADHMHTAPAPSPLDASPIPAINSHNKIALNEEDGSTDEGIEELLQATATTHGRLNYYYNRFVAACQKMTLLEGQKEEIEREFDLTKRKLDETEKRLREANADRWRLRRWVDTLLRRVDSIYSQLGLLREMANPNAIDNEEWAVYDPESQGGFDLNSI